MFLRQLNDTVLFSLGRARFKFCSICSCMVYFYSLQTDWWMSLVLQAKIKQERLIRVKYIIYSKVHNRCGAFLSRFSSLLFLPLFCSYYILKNQKGIRNNCINLVLAFLNYDSNNSQSPYEKEMLLSCSNFRRESQRSKFSINICVRRRKTLTNRVVFTEITLEGFINQS